MRLCVYAIMRDEAPHVAAWAETTGDADVRFVLDTGSTDDTRNELSLNGVTQAAATFEPFRFDDARNAALALAPPADLYFRLDADERLDGDWRARLEAVYDPHIARYRYDVVSATATTWGRHRREDCHVRAGHRWRYPTHEILVGPGIATDVPLLTVTHLGATARRPHHDANLDVLLGALEEYPSDHRMAFYTAREAHYAGRWELCRNLMVRFLDLPFGWAPERAEGYRILAAIDDFPERWLWKAIGEAPERREPWVDLSRLCLQRGEFERAATMWNEAALRVDETIYTTDPTAWYDAFDELRDEIDHHLSMESFPT